MIFGVFQAIGCSSYQLVYPATRPTLSTDFGTVKAAAPTGEIRALSDLFIELNYRAAVREVGDVADDLRAMLLSGSLERGH